MAYHVFLTKPGKECYGKTVTESEAVARFAFDELRNKRRLLGKKVKAVMVLNNKIVCEFDFDCVRVCMKCGFQGIFIRGDTCPTCKLVQ